MTRQEPMPDMQKPFASAEECFIGLDLGTTQIKGILLSLDGRVIGQEKAGMVYTCGNGGMMEFSADDFYMEICQVIHKLITCLPDPSAVKAVSMASASGNTLLVGADGSPSTPVISWMDSRFADEILRVFGRLDPGAIHDLVGWPLINSFPLAHLAWLSINRGDDLREAAHVCMSTEYVNDRLTGEWGIDPSTATTFYLQDQKAAAWSDDLLDKLSIPGTKLPKILPSGTVLGVVSPTASCETGLPAGTPVVLAAFDHPSAARGTGVFDAGQAMLSSGTSWVLFFPVADRNRIIRSNLLCDPFLRDSGLWGAMGSLSAVAASIDKVLLNHIDSSAGRYKVFDSLAAMSVPGANGLRINPMEMETAGPLDGCDRKDIARALMEGTAMLLRDMLGDLAQKGIKAGSITMVGGAAETHPWPQIVCDVLGLPMTVMNGANAGAAGAAILAGIGAGFFRDERQAFRQMDFPCRQLVPDPEKNRLYSEMTLTR